MLFPTDSAARRSWFTKSPLYRNDALPVTLNTSTPNSTAAFHTGKSSNLLNVAMPSSFPFKFHI